jgi:hypothetical protein
MFAESESQQKRENAANADSRSPACAPALGLWQGVPRGFFNDSHTPEPDHKSSPASMEGSSRGKQDITPMVTQSLQCSSLPVQTLHARDMPLSPFEWSEVPGEDRGTPLELAGSPSCAQLPHENVVRSDDGTAASPGASSVVAGESEGTDAEQVETSLGTSFHCASELEGQMAMMTDIPLSQTTSQESSLGDNKILRPPGLYCSQDSSESAMEGFLFSRAFSFIGLLGDTKTCTVYHAKSQDGHFAIKVRLSRI